MVNRGLVRMLPTKAELLGCHGQPGPGGLSLLPDRVEGGWLGYVRGAGSSIWAGGSDTPLPEKMNQEAPGRPAGFARTRTPKKEPRAEACPGAFAVCYLSWASGQAAGCRGGEGLAARPSPTPAR